MRMPECAKLYNECAASLVEVSPVSRKHRKTVTGTVEKFIGDAVMAVFGVPVVHEDDALCVRARSHASTICASSRLRPTNREAWVIGTIEIGGLISTKLDLSGSFWSSFENVDINVLGFVVFGMFAATRAIALVVWRFTRIE